eukprot:gene1628-3157_t
MSWLMVVTIMCAEIGEVWCNLKSPTYHQTVLLKSFHSNFLAGLSSEVFIVSRMPQRKVVYLLASYWACGLAVAFFESSSGFGVSVMMVVGSGRISGVGLSIGLLAGEDDFSWKEKILNELKINPETWSGWAWVLDVQFKFDVLNRVVGDFAHNPGNYTIHEVTSDSNSNSNSNVNSLYRESVTTTSVHNDHKVFISAAEIFFSKMQRFIRFGCDHSRCVAFCLAILVALSSLPTRQRPFEYTAEVDVDSVIEQLLSVRGARPGRQVNLSENEIRWLCIKSREIFTQQPVLLELEAPIKICGDIHGQYYDLLRLFEYGGFPPAANYLFLGDYVDRGKQSLETICLLLAYKIKYAENFFILRGNHECASINRIYGFYDECKRRYNIKLWKTFTDCFNCLPVAAIVDEKIFCMHGGLSPELQNMEQIKRIMRPTDIPDTGLLCDLLWADPDKDIVGWGENDRGVSFTFGEDVVAQFLRRHDLDLICRAHQVVEDGYEFFARRQLVTIFSAPNYCGEFDNAGAMMSVDDTLMCSFQILKPAEKRQRLTQTQEGGGGGAGRPNTPPAARRAIGDGAQRK